METPLDKMRILILAGGLFFVWATVAAVFLHVIPEPHRPIDYLVIGTVATFASLLVLFLVLTKTWVKDPNLFFKRRQSK